MKERETKRKREERNKDKKDGKELGKEARKADITRKKLLSTHTHKLNTVTILNK